MRDLSDRDIKAIIARRDARYDGRFYFAVKTTKIYCRVVCPAKPKPENILIVRSPSEAERLGFRPCLRCRPDIAPGSKFFDGTMNTVARALRIIQDCSDQDLGVERLAGALGVSDRHLRRLFDGHLGASPIEIILTQRLHFAKQLVQETALPMTELAFTAGFQSVRRFNEAFKARFHHSPSALRQGQRDSDGGGITLRIPIRLPYDWETVLAYLERHATFGLETVGNAAYRRYLPHGNGFGSVVVTGPARQSHLTATLSGVPLSEVRYVLGRLRILFDTDHNPVDLPTPAGLRPRGIRVPGSFDPFETAVSIILGQLVSTAQARGKLKTLVQSFGRKIGDAEDGPVYAFPSPKVLAEANVADLGLTKVKGEAIRILAHAVQSGDLDFKSHKTFDVTTDRLLAMRGIGPWTAAMIAMRCLGNPDAFPERDLIIQRAVAGGLANQAEWGASRAYMTHCVWRDFAHQLSRQNQKTAPKGVAP